jgi:hypothetical protein
MAKASAARTSALLSTNAYDRGRVRLLCACSATDRRPRSSRHVRRVAYACHSLLNCAGSSLTLARGRTAFACSACPHGPQTTSAGVRAVPGEERPFQTPRYTHPLAGLGTVARKSASTCASLPHMRPSDTSADTSQVHMCHMQSEGCVSYTQGLLRRRPSDRLRWSALLLRMSCQSLATCVKRSPTSRRYVRSQGTLAVVLRLSRLESSGPILLQRSEARGSASVLYICKLTRRLGRTRCSCQARFGLWLPDESL